MGPVFALTGRATALPKGEPGPLGPVGPLGPQGPAGPAGKDGTFVFAAKAKLPKALKVRGKRSVRVASLKVDQQRTVRLKLRVGRNAKVGSHKVEVRLKVGGQVRHPDDHGPGRALATTDGRRVLSGRPDQAS